MSDIDGTPIYVGEGLGAAGARLNGQAAAIEELLQHLRSLLAPLEEAWTHSTAATYYQDLKMEWDIAAMGLYGPDGVLGQIAHAMNVNWANYTAAEEANISTWRHR
ncbi:WXG100 family type VII secretion target [Streptomyces shenzhenensis]|uniref:WXG100 family type VII secretion target n=1 Tax=Streptomyces shenzhenensis TaxID=943815 RepID=UPI0033E29625